MGGHQKRHKQIVQQIKHIIMRINNNLKIRTIAGESVVIMNSAGSADMTKVISLNGTAKWLWDNLSDKEFSEGDVADLLCSHYDVQSSVAQVDAKAWVAKMKDCGAIV